MNTRNGPVKAQANHRVASVRGLIAAKLRADRLTREVAAARSLRNGGSDAETALDHVAEEILKELRCETAPVIVHRQHQPARV